MHRSAVIAVVACALVLLAATGVCAPRVWYVETLDSASNEGDYPSVAIDANGRPCISYYDDGAGTLEYATRSSVGWHIETVDATVTPDGYTSVALDDGDHPHITYSRNGYLGYAVGSGAAWVVQTVDSAGKIDGHTSLALDADGHPHISYYDDLQGGNDPKYGTWNGSSWVIQTPYSDQGDAGGFVISCIALNASGHPRIVYMAGDTGGQEALVYAAWNGSSWDTQSLEIGQSPLYPSLALDATGDPHISHYAGWPIADLRYAVSDGGNWNVQTVDSASNVYYFTSLALDASGYPHISYWDSDNYSLKYAAWNGSGWDIDTVDTQGSFGITALALDSNGDAHIAYYSYGRLHYASTRPPAQATHDLPSTGYYMISFPLTPGSATPHDLLCDDLGCANYYMWRWQGTGYQTVPTSPPGCQSTTLSMLAGYWILAPAGTVGMRGTQPITDQVIPLQAGWNMVVAPCEATIDSLQVDNAGDVLSLAEAQAANWVLATFYGSHDGTGGYRTFTINQSPPDRLSLWHGYWVLAGIDCSLIIPVAAPSPPTASTAARGAATRPAWAFDIKATSGSCIDSVTIAAADGASDDFDGFALDRPKPPGPPGEGRVRVVLREGWRGTEPPPYNKAPGRQMPWASELAAETKGTVQEAADWELTVSGGGEGESVRLSWPELSRLPKERVAILKDRDTGRQTFMRTRAQYEFSAPGEGSSRSFAVTVKRPQQGAALISSLSVVPLRGAGGAEIAFSLSADASVNISVTNIAGRVVQRIRKGVSIEAGMHTIMSDGRSLSGTALPNGVYLCVLEAKTADGQRARRVCPVSVRR